MGAEGSSVTVRLLIFSGRPDPEWNLDEGAIPKLQTRVQTVLKESTLDQAPTGGLGYRGFLVQNPAKALDLPTEFIVFGGTLTERPGPQARHLQDTAGIEEFLLAEARQQGFGELLDAAGVKSQQVGNT
jgi:hypothetical protein